MDTQLYSLSTVNDEKQEETVIYGTVTINVIEQYAWAHAVYLSDGESIVIRKVKG